MVSRISGIIQIAAVYVGTIVGAGFATGREIVEFFSQYGFYGSIGIVVTGYLFILLGTKIMMLALSINAQTYQELNNYLFGQKWGWIVNFLFFIMLFGVTAVMLSGAGAVFEEQLNIPKSVGVFFTIGLAMLILHKGVQGLVGVNMVVVPMMILFSIILFVGRLQSPDFHVDVLVIPENINYWDALISPFLYSAFNLGLAQAVLIPLAYEVKDPIIIKGGGIVGGICLTVILLISHVSLLSLPNMLVFDIPSAELMKSLARPFYWIFIAVIYGEIFTSLVGNVFGLERQLQRMLNWRSITLFFVIFFIVCFISVIQYRILLSFLYPIFGYVCLLFLFLLAIKKPKGPSRK